MLQTCTAGKPSAECLRLLVEIVDREGPRLRELLLDGLIVRNGIADRKALEAYLGRSAPPHDYGFARVLQLADAELWARSWN